MYSDPVNVRGATWGDTWFLASPTGRPGSWLFYETVGIALLVQAQLMLESGTLPSDRTSVDNSAVGARTTADGVWGPRTIRQLSAYIRLLQARNLLQPSPALTALNSDLRNATAGGNIPPLVLQFALWATYFAPRLLRREIAPGNVQESVLPPVLFLAGNEVVFPVMAGGLRYSERLPFPLSTSVLTAEPTGRPYDLSLPATLVPELEALRDTTRGTPPPAGARGPWTIAAGAATPTQLPGATTTQGGASGANVAGATLGGATGGAGGGTTGGSFGAPTPAPPRGVLQAGMFDLGGLLLFTSASAIVGGGVLLFTPPRRT